MPRAARRPGGGPPRPPSAPQPPPNSTASSMVTDARSPVSIGNDPSSSARIPSSPLSFSSNDASGSVVVDGAGATAQQGGNGSSATSQPKGRRAVNSSKKQKVDKKSADKEEEPQGCHNPEQQRNQQPHVLGPVPMLSPSPEIGILNRRLREYMYFQRSRPADNSLMYWRKFVAEFYAPKARKRWCMSSHENTESRDLDDLCRTTVAWECDICGAKFGRGFEARVEVLPRLYQTKFDGVAADELLFLENAREWSSLGIMALDYAKAVIESIYEQQRVVHEGRLRVIFTPDLKILSWEFCVRRHEEFIPCKMVASQANQLLGVARKFQAAVAERGSCGLSPQELQASVNMFGTACCQLGRSLETQSSSLGFPRKFAWSLQMIDVVNSMKDLIDFSQEHKIGPIESLRNYNHPATAWFQAGERQMMEQRATAQGLPDYYSKSNKITGLLHSLSSLRSNNNISSLNNTAQGAATSTHHPNLTYANLNYNSLQPGIPCSASISNQSRPAAFPISSSSIPEKLNTISSLSCQSTPRCSTLPFRVDQHLTGYAPQEPTRDMMNSNERAPSPKQTFDDPNASGDGKVESDTGYGAISTGVPTMMNPGLVKKASELVSDNMAGKAPSKNNDIHSAANDHSAAPELDPFWQELMNNGVGDLGYKL